MEKFPISCSHEIVKNMTIIFFKRLYKVMYYVPFGFERLCVSFFILGVFFFFFNPCLLTFQRQNSLIMYLGVCTIHILDILLFTYLKILKIDLTVLFTHLKIILL